MSATTVYPGDHMVVERQDMQCLLDALHEHGYLVLGPTVQESAVVYNELETIEELPIGWTDEQDGGTYRLRKRPDDALFGYNLSPQSWKRFLHPPRRQLWQATHDEQANNIVFVDDIQPVSRYAFLGVRACELHAMAIQNTVFTAGPHVDPHYKASYDEAFTIVVQCGQAGGTCFCTSMKTGPRATAGFDLALTEMLSGQRHTFLVEVGSERGAAVLADVPHTPAGDDDVHASHAITDRTARNMGRSLRTTDLKEFLYANYTHPQWEEVSTRCLACANCTTVCPTCFCTTTEDTTDLSGTQSERWQHWDSCFTTDFSYIHGGSVRANVRERYRQWMTHKLATWIDQFGTSGCVGCGRCITWCPVGIDITAEVHAMHEHGGDDSDMSAFDMMV